MWAPMTIHQLDPTHFSYLCINNQSQWPHTWAPILCTMQVDPTHLSYLSITTLSQWPQWTKKCETSASIFSKPRFPVKQTHRARDRQDVVVHDTIMWPISNLIILTAAFNGICTMLTFTNASHARFIIRIEDCCMQIRYAAGRPAHNTWGGGSMHRLWHNKLGGENACVHVCKMLMQDHLDYNFIFCCCCEIAYFAGCTLWHMMVCIPLFYWRTYSIGLASTWSWLE